jgi:two-component system sensor histidine kinase KdpD
MEARIFEKFTRGEKESATPGIGLGLAICRAIAEAHGGKIGAANRIAADGRVEGARFWFTLPADTPPPVPEGLDDATPVDLADEHDAGETRDAPETPAAEPDADPPHRQPADTHPNTHS